MVYEHFSRCFILEDLSPRFGDILKLVALMLGVNRLLAMAKDI
jgi:hypothetical protein